MRRDVLFYYNYHPANRTASRLAGLRSQPGLRTMLFVRSTWFSLLD